MLMENWDYGIMTMNNLHINRPEVFTDYFRILPKRCRKFVPGEFIKFEDALDVGMVNYPYGFRIFRQRTYEWYDPLSIEVAKIAEKKKWEKI